jgi:HK97 family phage major capsid protein/HK97 family phage prohead protease
MNRAYSLLAVKSVDDEKRIIEGIATTPTPDRYADVVEPKGMEFKLPLPLLYQHNSRQPIGNVVEAKVTNDGISIKAQMAGPGVVGYIDEAWALIKAGLVRGLSIGFRSLEDTYDRETGGVHYLRSEWLELSAVTIPAQAEATITSVKSADALLLAAPGMKQHGPARLHANLKHLPVDAGLQTRKGTMKTLKEQIASFEATLAANDTRIEELISKAADEGRTFHDNEQQEHDNLKIDNRKIAGHVALLKERDQELVAKAAAITPEAGIDPQKGAAARGISSGIQMQDQTPKGIGFIRTLMAMASAKNHPYEAIQIAKKRWPDQAAAIEELIHIKAEQLPATTSGTTWASPLMQASQRLVGEFIELLRPATIIGRIPGLRRVPFNVTVPVQSGGGTYQWVGENAAKPVSGLSLTTAVLRQTKVAGIIPYTKEALRISDPSIEMVIRNDMIRGVADYEDSQFIDPTVHDSIGVNPPSITDQIVNVVASGLTATLFIDDMSNIVGKMLANNQDPADLVILMSNSVALNLSSKRNSQGARYFPDINVGGGNYNGIPIITSKNVGARIILLNPSQILIAEDPAISIDMSEEASLIMTTTPGSSPAASQLVSLWQNNLIGLRVDHFITWKRGLTAAVEYLSSAVYSGTT